MLRGAGCALKTRNDLRAGGVKIEGLRKKVVGYMLLVIGMIYR